MGPCQDRAVKEDARLSTDILLQFLESLLAAGSTVDDEDRAVAIVEEVAAALRYVDRTTEVVHPIVAAHAAPDRHRAPHERAAAAEVVAALDLRPLPFERKAVWESPPTRSALIARKVAVIPCQLGVRQALSHEVASAQVDLFVRWEVPSPAEAARAERVFLAAGTRRIDVRVLPDDTGGLALSGSDPLVEAVAACWLWISQYPDDDTDLGAHLAEDVLGQAAQASPRARAALADRIRTVAAAREAPDRRLLEELGDDVEA